MQCLKGDFSALCHHIHLLFTGKAIDWYWRFHRIARPVDWGSICFELRNQFRDRRTDFDSKELTRSCKQRVGEKFDNFYDAILVISVRLQNPFSEFDLVEILKKNLRPEIRKEIFLFNVKYISDLRDFVRKHEILEDEISKYKTNRNYNLPNVSEITIDIRVFILLDFLIIRIIK